MARTLAMAPRLLPRQPSAPFQPQERIGAQRCSVGHASSHSSHDTARTSSPMPLRNRAVLEAPGIPGAVAGRRRGTEGEPAGTAPLMFAAAYKNEVEVAQRRGGVTDEPHDAFLSQPSMVPWYQVPGFVTVFDSRF